MSVKADQVPDYYVYVKFQKQTINLNSTNLDPNEAYVFELRIFLSNLLGLPLSIFRLKKAAVADDDDEENDTQADKKKKTKKIDLYDCWTLKHYDITKKCTFILETWHGWDTFLDYCIKGFTKQCLKAMSMDEMIRQYQMKVALYISAHYGSFELASTLMATHGVRADRPGRCMF